MQGWGREIDTLSVRRPQPHTTNLLKTKRIEQLGQQYNTTYTEVQFYIIYIKSLFF